jgi:hypothetical protein
MLNEFAKEWVKALRSGKYKQAKNVLYEADRNAFCCLGVACDISGLPPEKWHGNEYTVLPLEVQEKLNLSSKYGCFQEDTTSSRINSLVNLNDNLGYSFDQIADIIEAEPAGLFNDKAL